MTLLQRIPVWWRWYYWANPVAWSLYGLVASQFSDIEAPVKLSDGVGTMPTRALLKHVFGFRHDYIGIAGTMVAGFCLLFGVIFAFAIKSFNFQRRWFAGGGVGWSCHYILKKCKFCYKMVLYHWFACISNKVLHQTIDLLKVEDILSVCWSSI